MKVAKIGHANEVFSEEGSRQNGISAWAVAKRLGKVNIRCASVQVFYV